MPKNLYDMPGTPPGYHWITIREEDGHRLNYRHILVSDAGHVANGPAALRGANVAVIAPKTARRHKLGPKWKNEAQKRAGYREELKRIAVQKATLRQAAREEAAEEYRFLKTQPSLITQTTQRVGKIKPSKDYSRDQIPLSLLSKNGQPVDSVADQMGYDSVEDFLVALHGGIRYANKAELEEQFEAEMIQSEDYRMLDFLEQAVKEGLAEKRPAQTSRRKKAKTSR